MQLKQLSDETLLKETAKLCEEERKTLSLILHHLREIDRRRLYASLKYPSLFEYIVKELGYSEDQAFRRISAMRLLKEIPEIEEKINSGTLSLTNLGLAHSFFNKEKQFSQKEFNKEDKIEFLKKLENQSKRDAEKIVISLSSNPIQFRPERERVVSEEMVEINFLAKNNLREKIHKLKGLLAHKSPNLSTADLMERLCDLGLEKWGKGVYSSEGKIVKDNSRENNKSYRENDKGIKEVSNEAPTATVPLTLEDEKWVAASKLSWENLKKQVWRRDKGQCRNCGSSYALEVDHILPKAKGGGDTLNNLRLLCRSCNQRSAIKHFGINKMAQHLN